MRKFASVLLAVVCTLATISAAAQVVDAPGRDTAVLASSVTFRGRASNGTTITVTTPSGTTFTTTAAGGTWTIANVPLAAGFNALTVKIGSTTFAHPVTRASNISARPAQLVRLVWQTGVDDELKKIAVGTLSAQLTEAQKNDFVTRVKARVAELFAVRFAGVADITLTQTVGANDHIVSFRPVNGGFYGESPLDCGNRTRAQTSIVYVGFFRQQMVSNFSLWKPMKMGDTLADRIEDVAQALGRTSPHETGHSLGFVGSTGNCRWMNGCENGHTCQSFQTNNRGVNRFNYGRFIMDAGPKTSNQARLAEASKVRSTPRVPAVLCNFDQSYLRIIHPLP